MFKDRQDAGVQLAKKLEHYRGTPAVVLALPRGGVVLGAVIAKELGLPLDIAVTRKIGHPGDPEYALCAVDADGTRLCNEGQLRFVDKQWLEAETARQQEEARRRVGAYRGKRGPVPLAGAAAIIVDDGIATGLTMRLAVEAVAKQHPKEIVVAVPVAPPDAVRALKKQATVVLLEPPEEFVGAVGAHYENFPQVEDAEVVALLNRAAAKH